MTKTEPEEESNEIMRLIYRREGPYLYGCVQYFKPAEGQETVAVHRQSAPFVISQEIGRNEECVYGSVYDLIQQIHQLIKQIDACKDKLETALNQQGVKTSKKVNASTGSVIVTIDDGDTSNKIYFGYTREITNILLLLSSQARNLLDIFPRFNRERIPLLDYEGHEVGKVPVREVFNYFVHNRYLFVDGEHVSDFFSDKFARNSRISDTFMGYKIRWRDYVAAVRRVINDVRIRDLSGLIRGSLKRLLPSSSHKDVVFLIQNVESFSRILAKNIQEDDYKAILSLLFNDMIDDCASNINLGKGPKTLKETITFTTPQIKIYENLSERMFEIQARCGVTLEDENSVYHRGELREFHKRVGYRKFFEYSERLFWKRCPNCHRLGVVVMAFT